MSKITLMLFFLLFGALTLLVAIILHPLQLTADLPTAIRIFIPNNVPRSDLYLSPAAVIPAASGSGEVSVVADTKSNTIGTVQLEIGYDPGKITVTSVTPGNFLGDQTVLLSEINNDSGRISYAATTKNGEKSGKGILTTINFWVHYPVLSRTTAFRFYPKTGLMHIGETGSLIATSSGAEIILPYSPTLQYTATPSSALAVPSVTPIQ